MAIRLASAIGQQREPIGILGGLDDAINRTGGAFQADQLRKSEAAAKKKDQEQKLKDAIAATVVVDPLDKAFPEEKKEYEDYLTKGIADIVISANDPNITAAQLKKKKEDLEYGARDRKNVYSRAYDAFSGVGEKKINETHDTQLFDNWFLGKENTRVANMPNDDFMAASEADRAGKMVGEGGMQATETQVTSQTVPYLNKSFEEKKKIDFASKADELVSLKRPNTLAAAKGYSGKDFEFKAHTKKTDKVTPTTGEIIYEFDEAGADLGAKKFASSMIGKGSFGDKNHAQYQRALENEALVAGNEAGFTGDKLAAFVAEVVPKMAYDDYMLNARSAYDSRVKDNKDITKQPGKGLEINFTSGGGASKGSVTIEPVKDLTPTEKESLDAQSTQLEGQVKNAETIAEKYKSNPNSPAYKNAMKSLAASRKALTDIEEAKLSLRDNFLLFSNKKSIDDSFIDINNDGKTKFRVVGFEPSAGGYNVLGVERTADADVIKNIPLTESVYKKIITENPDADDVMNKLGVKPSVKKETPKAAEETPTITSKAEFDKLPKGALYKKADGKTYKKG